MSNDNLKLILIESLKNYFNENQQGFTSFRLHIESLLKEHIKPLTSRSSNSSKERISGWRQELTNRFKGRGSKWVFVSLEEIESTLKTLENNNISCQEYRKNIKNLNKAWIRFSGPKLLKGIPHASFEVRTKGSTIDHPKQLHYIPVENTNFDSDSCIITLMSGTPKYLKLEEDSKGSSQNLKSTKDKVKKIIKQKKLNKPEVNVESQEDKLEISLPDFPSSNNPDDWESFLKAEGLVDFEDLDL